ncbi:hypothetical protein DXM27_07315 [Rhizobium rhizogenes]|uniref:Uncharacterized protein n=1 Tax=Rhizobium rhizogenes TaxID=359 RepID=A0AA88F0S5_RHIRH|nr:hypothetical protein [Rhizobium rhizogenes]KAA3502765.1 hypothetical protein DXM27_07315 [Rhizobium rhizogenes]
MTVLLYIDEEPAQGNRVVRAAYRSGYFSKEEVDTVTPLPTVDEMIEYIVSVDCKVLISDYRLGEKMKGVKYNGLDLIREFLSRHEDFPCFLTTNWVGEALNEHVDVNFIFPKSDLDPDAGSAVKTELPFFKRVKAKIEERERIVDANERRYLELQTLHAKKGLGSVELQELLDLDDFFESIMSKKESVPRILKERAIEPMDKLLQGAELLISQIEDELKKTQGSRK